MIARNVMAVAARVRWSLLITARRGLNRLWDAAGRAAGFCMADTWRDDLASYGKGQRHWRCYCLRGLHARTLPGSPMWHRRFDYRWQDGQDPIFDPLVAPESWHGEPVPGRPPRWLRGRHHEVGTRSRDRRAQRAAFERIRARVQAGLVGQDRPLLPDHARRARSLQHAFTPGQKGTHLEIYCQAPAEPGTGPVPGYTTRECGWPESRHPTPKQAAQTLNQEVADVIAQICGDDKKGGDQ